MEDLSDASFLSKLLVLAANVRLDWKVIARYKHFSLLGLIVSDEVKKSFITWTPSLAVDVLKLLLQPAADFIKLFYHQPWDLYYKTFYGGTLRIFVIS